MFAPVLSGFIVFGDGKAGGFQFARIGVERGAVKGGNKEVLHSRHIAASRPYDECGLVGIYWRPVSDTRQPILDSSPGGSSPGPISSDLRLYSAAMLSGEGCELIDGDLLIGF